jgi:hypothetical protein
MNTRFDTLSLSALLVLFASVVPGVAFAQAPQPTVFVYAVKFICGKSDGKAVAPGTYFTAINVHNPAKDRTGFSKKFAIALPAEKPGSMSKFINAELGPDEALEIDCRDIFEHTQSRADFFKGFAVIESKVRLDVVAVYTAAGATGQVETLYTERVSPQRR